MRCNVLKRTLSEDLTWANILKETMGEADLQAPKERKSYVNLDRSRKNNLKTRSLNSTPERSKPEAHFFNTVQLSDDEEEEQKEVEVPTVKKPRRRKKAQRK